MLEYVDDKTFIYLDPPYSPINSTSNFTSYNEAGFTDDNQIELLDFVNSCNELGAKIIISNSNNDFINDLYKDYFIHEVNAKRNINCNSTKRNNIKELIITNFRKDR